MSRAVKAAETAEDLRVRWRLSARYFRRLRRVVLAFSYCASSTAPHRAVGRRHEAREGAIERADLPDGRVFYWA